jgi:tripartite-type tricarboxylate transporter receptor subunit TctC
MKHPTTPISRRSFVATAVSGAAGFWLPGLAWSQGAIPTARMLAGFPAGGTLDAVTRLYAEQLRGKHAETMVVENRTGAGGRIAAQGLKASAADGGTLLVAPSSTMTLYPHVFKKLGYDPVREFTPVANLARLVFALAVSNDTPAKNLAEYRAFVRANPAKANYGGPAAGATPHFVGQLVADAIGTKLEHVAYRGSAPAVQDVLGGQLSAVVTTLGDVVQHHKANRLRIIAVSTDNRVAALPDVPTFREQGIERATVGELYVLYAPAGTPAAVVSRLNAQLADASRTPAVVEALARMEMSPDVMSTSALTDWLAKDTAFWAPVVKATGFQIED